MVIELTQGEVKTLQFYLEKACIDAEGMHAIGMASDESVNNLRSVIHKLKREDGHRKHKSRTKRQ